MVAILGKKLGIGFSLVITIMIGSILIGFISMNNVEKSIKFIAKDQMDATISTLEMRINRSERNFALKSLILFGKDEEILKREDQRFVNYHKKMN